MPLPSWTLARLSSFRSVKFELDLGWIEVSGQSAYEYIRRYPGRFPLFHVKDIRWDPNGPRAAAAGTVNAGRTFLFADLRKGVIDWPKIFSALKSPNDHHYFVEHDDAGADGTADATSPRPRNPAGSANTAWTGRKISREPGDPWAPAPLTSSTPLSTK